MRFPRTASYYRKVKEGSDFVVCLKETFFAILTYGLDSHFGRY